MKNKLTFGYLYDFRNPAQWRRPWAELYAEILDFAAWTESIGFDGVGSAIALAPLYHPGETFSYQGKHFTLQDASIVPPPPRGRIPLYLGGFNEKAIERTAKYGDGYFGNMDVVDLYINKLLASGKRATDGRIRIQGLFTVVAHDPEKAMHDLAPYFLHVNDTYGRWLNEETGTTGLGDQTLLQPMTLEAFKASRTLRILTPREAIDMFNKMLSKAPVEHFMMMLPPGLPPAKFTEYAETFAKDVIPEFR